MGARTYIELFAGCGGLSLGLASVGYKRLLANELSPMAAETYAYNLLATDLRSSSFAESATDVRNVLWIESAFPASDVVRRLSENLSGDEDKPYSDLNGLDRESLQGKLLVGDIRRLNAYLEQTGSRVVDSPDVISGGPPCQSFSLAGMREYGNQRNRLPWEFARFVDMHQPKLAILENVSGILHPFREGERRVHAWFEVAKAFAQIGYAPICLHVNAVNVGVAQNRPRFLMFAVRSDLVGEVRGRLGDAAWVMGMGSELLEARGNVEFDPSKHRVVDLRGKGASDGMATLAGIFSPDGPPASVSEAIDDLSSSDAPSAYVRNLDDTLAGSLNSVSPQSGSRPFNHALRTHTGRVRARFRIYQVLAHENIDRRLVRIVTEALRVPNGGSARDLALADAGMLWSTAHQAGLGLIDEQGVPILEPSETRDLVERLRTRKHSQRSLRAGRPAPAALSIPDDACHYRELRTLSVREMARIQSFPDGFVFRSTPTTGGARRKFQVPQYTQVGNAVPPKLGRAIGQFADLMLGETA